MSTVTCFGEILWDIFPTHKKIGGAPLNVALRLQSLGTQATIISRIGDDKDGTLSLKYIEDSGIDISNIQIDTIYKTGCVNVSLDNNGSASYTIEAPVAWDKIEANDQNVKIVKSSDAFIFGSLVCRDEITKNTLVSLLKHATFKVFDVNLRPPFYSMNLLLTLMHTSDFIKCNDDELNEICAALGFTSATLTEQIKFLSQHTQTKQICVTKGKDGATLFYNNQFYNNSGYPVKVADTVGAGDSFLATLIDHLLNEITPKKALNHACAVGSLVASKEGANPKIMQSEIINFINEFDKSDG